MNAVFQGLAEGSSSLRSSSKQLVRKGGRNLKGVGIAKVSTQYKRKDDTTSARFATICR